MSAILHQNIENGSMAGEENEPTKRLQPHLSKQDLSTLVSVLILSNFKILFYQLIPPTQQK